MDDVEEAGARVPQGSPILATLAGCALLVVAALGAPALLPRMPYATLIGTGAAFGGLLWAIGYVVTTRRAPLGWKAGSLLLLLGAGAVAGTVAHGQYQTQARTDASGFAEVEFGAQGSVQLPAGAGSRGRLSRAFVTIVQSDAQDQRDYMKALGRFGVGTLNSPYLLEQDGRAIANCGAVEDIKAMARGQFARRAERRAELEQALAAVSLPETARRGIGTMAGPIATGGSDPVLTNQLAQLDATSELCVLLAKRSWTNQSAYFGFNSDADKARHDAIVQRRLAIAGETSRIERAATERIREGRELVRAALSRSVYAPE
ncbi:hypothetical protein [Sphingomonas sp. M1-B02]|uniref:hypothetical protein n=1 Tax=Sphingomonas sp. M1-B02 TaxID=3114300 RepID=UPI002240CD85|nr:hypothetical protein [Sphingomonas sp. S6-11]UZK65491.1 hypothetical protein OKW87_13375 [Sphingomonas sp. S6-11]